MKKWTVVLALVLLVGCGGTKPSQVMVNPDTGEAKMVATHSWGYGAAGIAAAIGAEAAQKDKVETLKKAGYVEIEKFSTVGIILPKELDAKPKILQIRSRGPADLTGMRTGDLIIEKDGTKVDTVGALRSLPRHEVGQEVEYKVLRDGKELTFKMKTVSGEMLLKQ
jgi:S1-C subfamily serine protease